MKTQKHPEYFDYFRPADLGGLITKFDESESGKDKWRLPFEVIKTIPGKRNGGRMKYTTSLFLQNHNFWEPMLSVQTIKMLPLNSKSQCDAHLSRNGWEKPDRSWWSSYLEPILRFDDPTVNLHVYVCPFVFSALVAHDMVPRHHTYHVMLSSTTRHNPGAMWRFLGLDSDRPVLCVDADSLCCERPFLNEWIGSELAWWRRAHNGKSDFNNFDDNSVFYHAVTASHFGYQPHTIITAERIMDALVAFYWAGHRGLVQNSVWHPDLQKECPIFGRNPAGYGFDELFLNQVIFPWMIKDGMFSVFPESDRRSTFGDLDLRLCDDQPVNKSRVEFA